MGMPVVYGKGKYWVRGEAKGSVAEVCKAFDKQPADRVKAWCAAAKQRAEGAK